MSAEMEWLLDNEVNIVNCSFGRDTNGVYDWISAYLDYVVRNSWITIVCAAGNAGDDDGYVGDGGLGRNVVTVGSIQETMLISDFSSYQEVTQISKPNLVAFGDDLSINGIDDPLYGTSFSTPMVTGGIALLMQKRATLKAHPEMVLSLLSASAYPIVYNPSYDTSGLEETYGAGVMNIDNADDQYTLTSAFSLTSPTANSVVRSQQVIISGVRMLRASVAWIINGEQSTTPTFTNYNLRIKNSSGTIVASASSTYNNLEGVEYLAVPGTYTFEVVLSGSKTGTGTDYLSLSIAA